MTSAQQQPTLDIESPSALVAYLRDTRRIDPDEDVAIHILAGGVSNKTVLVQRAAGPSWVIKQALPKLRTAVDWFSDPRRIGREAAGLRWLPSLAPAGTITPLIFQDPPQNLIAMNAVPQPHQNWKTLLLSGQLELDHVAQFARLLAAIHRNAALSADPLSEIFDTRIFFESLRLEPYYLYTATTVPAAGAFLHELVRTTRSRRFTLVHGDFSPKNILVHQGRLILLDHEVIHWGDPAFDIGFALTHLLSKAHHITRLRQNFIEAAKHFWTVYIENLGNVPFATGLEAHALRHTVGCLLARVAGRSPLEYLTEPERTQQRKRILELIGALPPNLPRLIDLFHSGL